MTNYRYELGIDWTAVEQENASPQLQVGLVEVNGSGEALASPFALKVNDQIEFVVVDITDEAGATQRIDLVELAFSAAVMGQPTASPFQLAVMGQVPAEVSEPHEGTPSAYYQGTYKQYPSGIDVTALHEGRFLLKARVEATSSESELGSATWEVDPEMAVGPGG